MLLAFTLCTCTGGKGYSFMAWLRLEAVERAPHRAGRALFTLLSRSGGVVRGVAAAVRGALKSYTSTQNLFASALPQQWRRARHAAAIRGASSDTLNMA